MERAKKIGERVRTLREARHWNQSELARQVGVIRQNIWLIEHGRQEPGTRLLLELARVFGVTPQYLYGPSKAEADEEHPAPAGGWEKVKG